MVKWLRILKRLPIVLTVFFSVNVGSETDKNIPIVIKYFGIMMDEPLKCLPRISAVSRKISRGIGILAKLRNFLNAKYSQTSIIA